MKGRGILISIALFFGLVPAVSARTQIVDFLSRGFSGVFNALDSGYVQAGITLILFFLILYSVMLMGAKKIKIFQGENGLNKQGKTFAFALSALAVVGLFFAGRNSFEEMVRRILETTQVYGMIVFGIVIFLLTFYGFRPDNGGEGS
ncbi:MAG: hypothetical protein ACQEP1_03285 [Nanobdellota archaeon]